MELAKSNRFNTYLIYGTAIVVSFLLTWLSICQYRTFNADGVLYLQTARDFLQGGFKAAYQQYPWPFFSVLIAELSRWFGVTVLTAAYWLSGLFFALITIAFLTIVRQLAYSVKLQWLALFVILTFRPLTKYSHYIIRDAGYLAFFLVGVALLISFINKPRWYKAVAWNIAMTLALLFRVEGTLFLVLAPLIVWFDFPKDKLGTLRRYIQLNSLTVIYFIVMAFFVLLFSHHGMNSTGRLSGLLNGIVDFIRTAWGEFYLAVFYVSKYVLPPPAARFGWVFTLSGLIGTFIYCCIIGITLPYLVGLVYGLRGVVWRYYRAILVYVVIAFVLVSAYSFSRYYFVVRYFLPLSALLLTIAIPGLARLYCSSRDVRCRYFPWRKVLLWLVVLLMLAQAVSTVFHIGPSKRYRYLAAVWLREHTAPTATVYTNDGKIAFISNRTSNGWQCAYLEHYPKKTCFSWAKLGGLIRVHSDYLAISIDSVKQKVQLGQLMKRAPIKAFRGSHNRQVVIYQLKP